MITTKRADVQTNLPRSELIEMFLSGLPSDDKLLKRRYQPLAVIETIARYAEPNRAFRAVLYALLDTLGPENRTSFWGKRKRALACGVSAKTVQRAIKAFKERGWITVTKRFTGKGSYYVHDVGITSKLIENALAGPGANARRWGTAGAEAGQKTPVQGGPAVPSSEVGQSSPEGAGSPPEGGLAVPLTKKELLTGEVELAAQESEAEATTAGTSQPPEFLAQQEREYRPQDALNRTTCESAGITVSTALRASETAASCTKPGSGLLATTPVPGAVPAPPREGHGQIPGGLAAEAGPAATPVSRTPSVEGARPAAGAQTAAVNLKSGERSEARVEIPVVSEDTINLIDYFMSEFQRRKGRPCPARFNPELVNAAISAHGLPVMKLAVDAMLEYSKAEDIGLNLLCSPKTLPIWLERTAKKFYARAASAGAPQLITGQPHPDAVPADPRHRRRPQMCRSVRLHC